ncbi:MAG TPA: hypothetical protein VFE07_01170 [Marmoricola sp.]|nr:hypothetical protein [Marmoricola sp.]
MAPLFRRSSAKVPPLVPIPPIAELPPAKLQASARYLGTVDAQGERVIGQSLSAKSSARLSLSSEALDVVRIAGSFRIRHDALRGARGGEQFNGKPVRDLLLVRWAHEGHDWETAFRMEAASSVRDAAKAQLAGGTGAVRPEVDAWVRSIAKIARANRTEEDK